MLVFPSTPQHPNIIDCALLICIFLAGVHDVSTQRNKKFTLLTPMHPFSIHNGPCCCGRLSTASIIIVRSRVCIYAPDSLCVCETPRTSHQHITQPTRRLRTARQTAPARIVHMYRRHTYSNVAHPTPSERTNDRTADGTGPAWQTRNARCRHTRETHRATKHAH